MTRKLYWDRPYDKEFNAVIVDIKDDAIILDQTLFYPASGGQSGDTGTIKVNEMELEVDSVSKEGDIILHHVAPYHGNLEKEDEVSGIIDWENRHELMKAHTSQHVLSAVILRDHGVKTARVSIKPGDVELELERKLSLEKWADSIEKASIACTSNHDVNSRFVSRSEAEKLDVRGKLPDNDPLRIIEINGVDTVCCGGTHVANTSEIGPIYAYNIKKDKVIEYYTGTLGLSALSRNNVTLIKTTRAHNKTVLDADELIKKLNDDKGKVNEDFKELVNEYLALVSKKPDFEIDGISFKILKTNIDKNLILASFKRFPPDFVMVVDMGMNMFMVLSSCAVISAKELFQKLLDNYGGKGGGNPKVAQGKLDREPPDLDDFLRKNRNP
ncbi:MAG: alanyl-tRNA editing protein [Candidatus Hodarchaeota archaeon]